MLFAMKKSEDLFNIFNLGADDYGEVKDSTGWICEELWVNPDLEYSGEERGWIGDNPFLYLETQKIQSLWWKPKLSIRDGVLKIVQYLKENEWSF